jgi:phage terminase large subunit
VEVTIDYKPRAVFDEYHACEKRYMLTVAHRRAGKTVARINKAIRAAASTTAQNARYGYLAPYYVQAKDIAWQYLKHYSAPILALGNKQPNESELSITMPHNGAVIRLYGADNAERLRGLYFDGLIIDEAQDVRSSVLTQIIMPALADRQGWLDLSGTPKGWGNLLGETYKRAIADDEWHVQILKASKTGILPADELDRLRRAMPPNEYAQEFECSFDAAITGAYYADELTRLDETGRLTKVPYDPMFQVHTAWDLGISDSMSIWFYQVAGREIRIIDYYEASGYGLDHYAAKLKERSYNYGQHFAPHDIAVRELGTGKSRLEVAAGLGIRFDIVTNIPVADGINAARMTIPRCVFDAAKCSLGIDALRQYRERIDDKRQVSMGPLHDWTSHAADSFRYLAVSLSLIADAQWSNKINYPRLNLA